MRRPAWRPTPAAAALAALLAGFAVSDADARSSANWFAAGAGAGGQARAVQRAPMPGAALPTSARQQAQAREQLSRSIANLNRTANAIAAQQAAQEQARNNPQNAAWVRDGLGADGLDRLAGGRWDAAAPETGVKDGRQQVTIAQDKPRAILEWNSFHVGRNTDLTFRQASTDAVLNKVMGDARPSQIQGSIRADGTVMIVNQNGVVFTGSSQVNVRNLVAAAAATTGSQGQALDAQFLARGLYSEGGTPTFQDALGNIEVQAGARISTHAPQSVTQGGGYVLLAGKEVENAGTISTARGQAALAAGDSFIISRGQGTNANQRSTTRGNEIVPDGEGLVANSGLIFAANGDVTLTGSQVRQLGVALASTSQAARGTIHLSAVGTDANLLLGPAATTAIVLDDTGATALDSQRSSLLAPALDATPNPIVTADAHRRDLSLVAVHSDGTVDFASGSITLATGGQIAVHAEGRALVRDGAVLDVSGAMGVNVAMEANSLRINIQGNEQRDSPANRESGELNNNDVWVDRRRLAYVPAGTNGYESDRWYTAGGLLEVGGYLDTGEHSVGEWMAQGGIVRFAGGEVVTQAGSQINVSGGTLDVGSGYVRQSWLRGVDGRLYTVDSAPGDLLYQGLYRGYERHSARWGHTEISHNPLIAPGRRWEMGYTVGRDAGVLVIGSKAAVLEGDIVSDTYQGPRQSQAPRAGLDGYHQPQTAVARGGQLVVGRYTPYYDKESGTLRYGLDAREDGFRDIVFTDTVQAIAAQLDLDTSLPQEHEETLFLQTGSLNDSLLGAVHVAARGRIHVQDSLQMAPGGAVTLYGPDIEVDADIVSRGGSIRLGNVLHQVSGRGIGDTVMAPSAQAAARVGVAEGVRLDVGGTWSNLLQDPANIAYLPYGNGGTVSIRSSGDVLLAAGSEIDVSSGGGYGPDGAFFGGRGGDVTLVAGHGQNDGTLTLDGVVRASGVRGGGQLTLGAGNAIVIGGETVDDGVLRAGQAAPTGLRLAQELVLEVGDVLPFDVSYETDVVLPGEIVLETVRRLRGVSASNPLVVQADWYLEPGSYGFASSFSLSAFVQNPNGSWTSRTFGVGDTVPQGAQLRGVGALANVAGAGFKVPADVFPQGLPVETYTRHVAAGTAISPAMMAEAGGRIAGSPGTFIVAGSVLSQDVAVGPVVTLAPSLFHTGFARYDVASRDGVLVAPGTRLDVFVPVLQASADARTVASGAAAQDALTSWLPPLVAPAPAGGSWQIGATLRQGADLRLSADGSVYAGSSQLPVRSAVQVGQGASISVDPGRSIALSGADVRVQGELTARGGDIRLTGNAGSLAANRAAWLELAIDIGADALLDVSGAAFATRTAYGDRYTQVSDGGRIVLGGDIDEALGDITGERLDAFVVVREGARLNAAGNAAAMALPGSGTVLLASDGGAISAASDSAIYLEGTLDLAPGGAGASGGRLAVAQGVPGQAGAGTPRPHEFFPARELTLHQAAVPGRAQDGLLYGNTGLSLAQVAASGADQLSVLSESLISFDGDDLHLTLGRSLHLYSNRLGLSAGAPVDARVTLAAPYVRLAGIGHRPEPSSGSIAGISPVPTPAFGAPGSRQPTEAVLTIQAGQIDLRNYVRDGVYGAPSGRTTGPRPLDRRGFGHLVMESSADIRFLAAVGARRELLDSSDTGTRLDWSGDVTLRAAQLYPATGASASVRVGASDSPRRLRIDRHADAALPPAPYSAFGSLVLLAAEIEQGGIVRAPFGRISLGDTRSRAQHVHLLPGSLTSVSGAGLAMPYGGTADGIDWYYAGERIDLSTQQRRVQGLEGSAIQVVAGSLQVAQGAVLDVSGGGELLGAGFISGRGGSSDVRYVPLMRMGKEGPVLPGLDSTPVYAIVPGVVSGHAPVDPERGAVEPLAGQQITVGEGVPGLPAGTYTLMPSTYALLPGAFRVEVRDVVLPGRTVSMRDGSWATAAWFSTAGTGIADTLPSLVVLTPAELVRQHSQYNEASYADFVQASAAAAGSLRAALPADAKRLEIGGFAAQTPAAQTLRFDGVLRGQAAPGGYGGTVSVSGVGEIVAADRGRTAGFTGVSVQAETLNALAADAERLMVNTSISTDAANPGRLALSGSDSLTVRDGASLSAAEIVLGAARGRNTNLDNQLVIERGASISTLGHGEVSLDARSGYVLSTRGAVVIASNGEHRVLLDSGNTLLGPTPVSIGLGGSEAGAPAALYAGGTLAFATEGELLLDDSARYGARHLALALSAVNVGGREALADAAARGVLPDVFTLDQTVFERLLRGDTSTGAPAMETFSLAAAQGMNVFGDITLSTLDAQGRSTLDTLVLTTPAILGAGGSDNLVTIETGHLIWNGVSGHGAAPIGTDGNIGPGTGLGSLRIHADVIELGAGPYDRPSGSATADRLALGFSEVVLRAAQAFTVAEEGTLSVYQSRDAYATGDGWQYLGGKLRIETPAITGKAGAIASVRAGDEIVLAGLSAAAGDMPAITPGPGASLAFQADRIVLDTAIVLPSGKLTLAAHGDVVLTDAARIDMAGREMPFADISRYGWGGSVTLESAAGNIRQAAGSVIDLSARYNHAGSLTAVAVAEGAGAVSLLGQISGQASGEYDAGGTFVPYEHGRVDVRAQDLGDFAALNDRLNEGGVFGARHFQIKQGDLAVGDGVRARDVRISLDGGRLTVDGRIDASGAQVGSIRLAGGTGLALTANAVLDAHGERLRVDGHGQIIDAPNRAIVELDAGTGAMTLAAGAYIDVRHGTTLPQAGAALGTVTLTAPRLASATAGDVAIQAQGPIGIVGARSVAVQGNWRYDDAPLGSEDAASGRPYQVIDQDYLDGKHQESIRFIDAALANGNLLARLAGLRQGREDIFHLRPSVEITSATPDGDLVIQGDLDLSAHRYASLNPATQRTTAAGSGAAGALIIRAGGDLDIYGSINDGFAPPPETPDDKGWVLLPGAHPYRVDVIVPSAGVTLAQGTTFPSGRVLNYDVPLQGFIMQAGTELPVAVVLDQGVTLPANTVLQGDVIDHAGNRHAAGTLLAEPLTLAAGSTLEPGFVLAGNTAVTGLTWPAGVPLPTSTAVTGVELASDMALKVGAVIPFGTNVVLPDGAQEVPLRPEIGGQQGKNWAVAAMLPSGSQSWGIELVAGADLAAADSRATLPRGVTGNLMLSDAHYQFASLGGEAPGEAVLTWGPDASAYNFTPGEPVPPGLEFYCTFSPTMCIEPPPPPPPVLIWGPDAAQYGRTPGQPVSAVDEIYCTFGPAVCVEEIAETGGEGRVYSGMALSVIRTGAADLTLISAGDLSMDTLYGVYTAGSPTPVEDAFNRGRASAGAPVFDSPVSTQDYEPLVSAEGGLYQAWYPDGGGNLVVSAGRNLTGTVLANGLDGGTAQDIRRAAPTAAVGNWLWRQGTGQTPGVEPTPAAWWINFGSYVAGDDIFAVYRGTRDRNNDPYPGTELTAVRHTPYLVGFTGFGTLGGGNLTLTAGGDAGALTPGKNIGTSRPRSEGVIATVAATGRVTEQGQLLLTGGGDLRWHVDGVLNPDAGLAMTSTSNTLELSGLATNLRGATDVRAARAGTASYRYGGLDGSGVGWVWRDMFDATNLAAVTGGLVVMPGDSAVNFQTLGPLMLGGVGDPGRVGLSYKQPVTGAASHGDSWFSLWTDRTALHLFAAGGDVVPGTQLAETNLSGGGGTPIVSTRINAAPDGDRFIYPGRFSVVANGNIYLGAASTIGQQQQYLAARSSGIWLAPASGGELALLSAGSIYGGGSVVSPSSAAPTAIASPWRPAFHAGAAVNNIYDGFGYDNPRPLFAFGANTVTGVDGHGGKTNLLYAVGGDIVDLRVGEILTHSNGSTPWYVGGGPVSMYAGGDIIQSGNLLGESYLLIRGYVSANSRGNLFLHHDGTEVSRVHAGGRILTSNFSVAGPGLLELSAAESILMQDKAAIVSLGPVAPGDNRPGASIAVMAGMAGVDWAALRARYLDPARLADPDRPLADQPGMAVKVYRAELAEWLGGRYGFTGSDEEALAYFDALPPADQRIFLRQVYYAELRDGGREFNDPQGSRFGSYLRGREAIATLFPDHDADGRPIARAGDIVMFGGSGIRTDFGGDIELMAPGGRIVAGVDGVAPPASAGLITQGAGAIRLFSEQSLLLGLSRIMTTFGGDIFAWSEQGDINAGRGAKTTVLYTPPRRSYDDYGNVSLAPQVPSSGAGIATLNPIPEVPPGDIDLIAPLGTIDAGEAGIRVSGNVNIAALQVLNAENIQVQGEAVGIPVVAAVNVGALTSASAASTAAADAAQEAVARTRAAARQNLPSIISVQILGFGEGGQSQQGGPSPAAEPVRGAALRPADLRAAGMIEMVGRGDLSGGQRSALSEDERRHFGM
ncbi:filamentous hemagglutinin family protein [Orrella sp. JC864]|uniref:filamentous haemagglutinin family protein n=1 Tax=Orrella sp. JC864 TaxID=3120298 RepID=UPI00300B03A3